MIHVELDYSCGGCFASEKRKTWIKREFQSFWGGGFGSYVTTDVEKLVKETCPEGWIAFDPYTSCTYCPTCWAEIEAEVAETVAARARLDARAGDGA